LDTVTDTLGRVVSVSYGGNMLPSSITQTWKDNNGGGSNVTHTYASFTYTTKTLATDFDGVTVIGPPNGVALDVLEKITYADNSSTKFYYNDYAQVYKIENIAADLSSHVLNYVRTNLQSPAADQMDCPRFTETKSYVENFNSGNGFTFNNTAPASGSYSLPGNLSGSAKVIDTWMTGHPDNLRTKLYFGASGWNEGLPLATEDCLTTSSTCTTQKRWTWTNWTQDNTSLSYILNPRVTETRVGDETNTKKTAISYWAETSTPNIAIYGLVKGVQVFDSDLTTVLKEKYTTYNSDTNYVSRRIIGLPYTVEISGLDPNGFNLQSKVSYAYDEGGYIATGQSVSATQHDTAYGSSFNYRGNVTSVTKYDASNQSTTITSSVVYNTAGSPVSMTTPWNGTNTRTTRIGYTDNFNSTVGVSTYAYPTTLTDAAGSSLGDAAHSSTIKYRYDIGVNVEASSPAPTGQSLGKSSQRLFGEDGRLLRNSTYVGTTEKSYVRYVYSDNGIQLKQYAPIIDADGDSDIAEDEVLTETWTDGAGRARRVRTEHPGSTGGWTATQTEYDILGRAWRTTVPTEVSVNTSTNVWTPAGDDSRGVDGNGNPIWLWNTQEFDWKGRTTRSIPSDSNGSDGKDRLFSYEGCGCAGGEVVTIQGENIIETDYQGNNAVTKGRRKQKVYNDVLGRIIRSEAYDWDGTTIKTFALNTYNGRDQILATRQYGGATTSAAYQDTTATYDGFGRLATSHNPEQQESNGDPAHTSYTYFDDGAVESMTDARGATTNYTYNNLGLVEDVSWSAPSGSFISVPDPVSMEYDNLGNRTSMEDGLGHVTYNYNSLSQQTSETRYFDDNLANAPVDGSNLKSFTLSYTYALSGQLKSYTDPYGEIIEYARDRIGRLSSVTGSSFNSVTNYASSASYRAWGALKGVTYGDTTQASVTYNDRLQASAFDLTKSSTTVMGKTYSYYQDGSFKYIHDTATNSGANLYKYDHAGRMTQARSAVEARGGTETNDLLRPFRYDLTYNNFGNMTGNNWKRWSDDDNETHDFQNNRIYIAPPLTPWNYDKDGRDLNAGTFDAAGHLVEKATEDLVRRYYDGTGKEAKRSILTWDDGTSAWVVQTSNYFIRSSVLGGQLITEADKTGRKAQTYVIAAGAVLARQLINTPETTPTQHVVWEHRDPGDTEVQYTDSSGAESTNFTSSRYDPMGRMVGHPTFQTPTLPPHRTPSPFNEVPEELGGGCQVEVDGLLQNCDLVTANNTGIQVRHGNKIERSSLHEIMPGVISFSVTFYDLREGHSNVHAYEEGEVEQSARDLHPQNSTYAAMTLTFTISWNLSHSSDGRSGSRIQGPTGPAPLTDEEKQKFDGNVDKIDKKIRNGRCKEFLESIFGSQIADGITQTFRTQQAFSGPRSTGISVLESGIYSPESLAEMFFNGVRDPGFAGRVVALLNKSVAQWFADNKGSRTVGAVTVDYYGNPNTVFYRSFDAQKMLHEALHIVTGLGDDELAAALGVDISKFQGDSELSSASINQKLKEAGCNL
jgi:YD repeat-containing protein